MRHRECTSKIHIIKHMREQGKWNRNCQGNLKIIHSVEVASIKQNEI